MESAKSEADRIKLSKELNEATKMVTEKNDPMNMQRDERKELVNKLKKAEEDMRVAVTKEKKSLRRGMALEAQANTL